MKIVSFYMIAASLLISSTVASPSSLRSESHCNRPGFYVTRNDSQCQCPDNTYNYNTMLQCNGKGDDAAAYISAQEQWFGNFSGVIVMGVATYIHRNTNSTILYLPKEWAGLNEAMCGDIHRQGDLCGQCEEGYGPSLGSHNYKCVKCDERSEVSNWLLYITLEYVPLTIFFVILLIFDIKTTSGLGNAFVFFAQMVTTTSFSIENDDIFPLGATSSFALNSLYWLPYSVWNLDFLAAYPRPYCLSSSFDNYGIISLNYAVAIYPMILIVVFSLLLHLYDRGCKPLACLCAPMCRLLHWTEKRMQTRRSIIGVFATLIIVSYTQFVFTAFTILTPNQLYNDTGYCVFDGIPFYNGATTFSTPFMVALIALSGVVLTLLGLLLPLLLVFPSFVQFLHRRTKWEWLVRLVPRGKIQEFLQGFHGCYKDGSNYDGDYRWFSGVYLLLRVIFFAVYSFTDTTMFQRTIMGVLCFLVILLIAVLKPFKRSLDNTANIAVLSLLGIINILAMYNVYRTYYELQIEMMVYIVQYTLVLVPLIVACGYYFRKYGRDCCSFCKYIYRRRSTQRHSINTVYVADDNHDDPASPPLDIDHEKDLEDFFDFTERSGRLKTSREATWMIRSFSEDTGIENRPVSNYGSVSQN